MKIQLIEYLKLQKFTGHFLYIYKWIESAFYAIIDNNIFLVNIPQKYNHLIIITRNVKSFKRRLYQHFSPEHVTLTIMKKERGFIIPNNNGDDYYYYTPEDLVDGKNRGIVIKLYCSWAHILYAQIRMKGEKYFFIDALSQHQSLSQCFLNHFKLPPKGLFRIKQQREGCCSSSSNSSNSSSSSLLQFISDDVFKHFPFPFNITHINVNDDDTAQTYTLTTVRALSFFQYEKEEKIVIKRCEEEDDTLRNYLSNPKSGLFLTGWNNESLSPLLLLRKRKFLSWKIIINISDCKEQILNILNKDKDGGVGDDDDNNNDDDDDSIFNFLLSTRQKVFPTILQLLHMTINDCVKLSSIAAYYFYNFMLQRNVPVLLWQNEKTTTTTTKTKIKGGLVFNPLVGVYQSIGVVDFQSLYPNVIIQYGITKGNVSRVSINQYKSNEKWYNTHFYTMMDDDEKQCYLSLKIQTSPVQLLFQHLINKRFFEKRVNKNEMLAKMIKLITNSIYGYYYLPHIPSLYDPLSACMITRYGRYYLKEAKLFITKHFPNTVCLYGDTDSLFLSIHHHHYTLQDIIHFYNSKHCLKLTIESEFQRLILIRKKQYIGKLSNDTFKFSGFPRKGIPPRMYQLMTDILRQILDDADNLDLEKKIETFLKEARHSKKPSDFFLITKHYQSSSSSLVFKLTNNRYCLEREYDPFIHVIDKKATILYHLGKVLDPLLVTVLKHPPLSNILFLRPLDNIIKNYLTMGYEVVNFFSQQQQQQSSSFLSIKFNQPYFNEKIQTLWESPPPSPSQPFSSSSSASSSTFLSLNITLNEDGEYATIDDTLFQTSPRFYSLQQLEKSLIPVFEYDKYNYLLRHHVQLVCSFRHFSHPLSSLKIFLQFISGIKLNDEQKQSSLLFSIVRSNNNKVVGIVNEKDVITLSS